MIETRYDIEYVDPKGKPKSGLGRILAYILLLITLLAFLAALIFSNLSNNASQLVTQKIQELSGIDTKYITNTVASDKNAVAENTNEANQKILASTKDENKEYKREIENQKLRKNLKHITQQLAEEKKASELLAKKVEALNNENAALSKQLSGSPKTLAREKNKKVATLVDNEPKKAEPKTVEKIETPKAATVRRTNKLKNESIKTEEPAKPKPAVATQETIDPSTSNKATSPEKTKAPISQMDAILEAMKATQK